MSAFRRLTDYERGRITLLLNQTDPPSVRTISKRFGLDPSTIHKIRKDAMRTGSKQIVANAETKAPEVWQMTHGELRDKLTPSNKTQLAGMRHLLPKLFPEYTDHEPEPNNDYHHETHRAYHRGDTLPRLPFVELSKKHRTAIKDARAAGHTIPQAVLDDYPGV